MYVQVASVSDCEFSPAGGATQHGDQYVTENKMEPGRVRKCDRARTEEESEREKSVFV